MYKTTSLQIDNEKEIKVLEKIKYKCTNTK